MKIEGIDNYEIWYKVDCYQFLKYTKIGIKCHHITYSKHNRMKNSNIEIPNHVNKISPSCFSGVGFQNIIIPNSVTSLGKHCFNSCSNSTNIDLSNNLTSIPDSCFHYCSSLMSIHLPSSIQSIGELAFVSCLNIQTINLHNCITSIQPYCFSHCTFLQSIILPSSLTQIKGYTFVNCSSLSNIELPPTIVSIGDGCFLSCQQLTTIILPSSLNYIGSKCFMKCGLESIELPNSIKSIGVNCFGECTSLTNIMLQSEHKEFSFKVSYNDSIIYKRFGINCTSVALVAFDDITQNIGINEFVIPSSFVELGNNVFRYKRSIKSIIIPSSITRIPKGCFEECTSLTSISIPTTVTSIGMNCFCFCESLTTLSIPSNVKFIGKCCFIGCNKLQQLTLPLNENNKYPFKVSYSDYLILKQCGIDCEKKCIFDYSDLIITNYQIPTDLPLILNIRNIIQETTIQDNVVSLKFNYLLKDITTITIPSSVTYLCNDCFKGYTNLQSITIPTTVNYIGKHLIDDCSSLTQIQYNGDWNNIVVSYTDHLRYKSNGLLFNNIEYTNDDLIKYGNGIPSIVHSLKQSCYNGSNDIFHIPTYITLLDNRMFSNNMNDGYSQLQKIIIPTSITTIPKHCFCGCNLLTSIELPSTLVIIKKKAFKNCISLESIIIPSSVIEIGQHTFNGCFSLTSITLPTSIQLGIACFKGCDQLKGTLNLPGHYF